jgi:hypothetical protein
MIVMKIEIFLLDAQRVALQDIYINVGEEVEVRKE